MPDVVETLTVKIEADTNGLRKDLQKSGVAVKRTGDQMSKSAARAQRSFRSLAGGVTRLAAKVGLAVGAFLSIRKVMTAFAESDALAKSADRLGLTTEALAGLQLAASQTGVSTSLLENSILGLNRRLGEAAEAGGPAAERLARLGLSAEELLRLPVEEQIGAIGDALNDLPGAAAQSAAAFDLFGRQGAQILNTLKLGTDGLEGFKEEAIDLGFAIGRVDAAKIEAANDAFDKLGKFIQGQARLLAIELAPALEAVTIQFLNAAKGGDAMGEAGATAGKVIVGAFTVARQAVAGFRVIVNAGSIALGKLGEFATMAADIGIRAFRALAGGVFRVGEVALGISDVFVRAFQDIAERSRRVWEFVKAGAEVAASGTLIVWDGVKRTLATVFDTIVSRLAKSIQTIGQSLAPIEAFAGLEAGIGDKLANTGAQLQAGIATSTAASKRATETAGANLAKSVEGFTAAKNALFDVPQPTGSEALQNLSGALGELADQQFNAAVSGEATTKKLQENLQLLREFVEESQAGLSSAQRDAAAVGGIQGIETALAEFDQLRKARQAEFERRLEEQAKHRKDLQGVNMDANAQDAVIRDQGLNQLFSVTKTHLEETQRQWKGSLEGRAQLLGTFFNQIATLQNSESKKQFEIGKAAAIAEAGINTFLSATKAFQSLAGIPIVGPALGAAAAAAAVAAGVQNIQNIRSQQFGGGGGAGGAAVPATASAAGAGGAVGAAGGGEGGPVQTQQFNIALEGDRFSDEQVRTLIQRLNDQIGDNATLLVQG